MVRLQEQFMLLNPQMKSPSDGPDCVEGGVWIINQKIAQLVPDAFSIGRITTNNKRF